MATGSTDPSDGFLICQCVIQDMIQQPLSLAGIVAALLQLDWKGH
jgi:hypothetical protein